MEVIYPVVINGKSITLKQDCETDTELFKFLAHMSELFDNTTCERNGQKSEKTKIQVRKDKEENEYYEMVCIDPEKPECNFAKRAFGANKKGGTLFPKNKTDDGKWQPWTKFNKETGKEE